MRYSLWLAVSDLFRVLADMVERRAEVVARLKSLEEAAVPLVSFLQNANAVQQQMVNDRYKVCNFPFENSSYSCETSLM